MVKYREFPLVQPTLEKCSLMTKAKSQHQGKQDVDKRTNFSGLHGPPSGHELPDRQPHR